MATMPKKWNVSEIVGATCLDGVHEILSWWSYRSPHKRRRTGWCLVWTHSDGDSPEWTLSGVIGRSTETRPDWHWCAAAHIGTTTNDHSRQRQRFDVAPSTDDVVSFMTEQCPPIPPPRDAMEHIENYQQGRIREAWMRVVGGVPAKT